MHEFKVKLSLESEYCFLLLQNFWLDLRRVGDGGTCFFFNHWLFWGFSKHIFSNTDLLSLHCILRECIFCGPLKYTVDLSENNNYWICIVLIVVITILYDFTFHLLVTYHKLQPRTNHCTQILSNSSDKQPPVCARCNKWRNVHEMDIEFVDPLKACLQHLVFHGNNDDRRPSKLYLKHTRKTLPSEMWMTLVLFKNQNKQIKIYTICLIFSMLHPKL